MTETRYFLRQVGSGKEIPIAPPVTVGRSEENTLRLVEGKLSRQHAHITSDQTRIFVEDLGSTNGTFVNGRRLDPKVKLELRAGDRVRFDIEEFVFVAPVAAGALDVDKTLLRSADPEKTQYRPAPPEPREAEVLQRTMVAENRRAEEPKKGGSEGQRVPGSFPDPEGKETIHVVRDRNQNPAGSIAPMPKYASGDVPFFWIESGKGAGTKIELKSDRSAKMTWRIGSDDGNDIRFDEDGVSGQHATLHHDNSTWCLTDDISINGTFVNDKKILKGYLTSGDRVCFGPVACRFHVPPTRARARASSGARWRKFGLIAALAFAVTLALLWVAYRFSG